MCVYTTSEWQVSTIGWISFGSGYPCWVHPRWWRDVHEGRPSPVYMPHMWTVHTCEPYTIAQLVSSYGCSIPRLPFPLFSFVSLSPCFSCPSFPLPVPHRKLGNSKHWKLEETSVPVHSSLLMSYSLVVGKCEGGRRWLFTDHETLWFLPQQSLYAQYSVMVGIN